ncbi:hypothetical protein BP6252_06821 [Coleophoma cylindrospora]|uniref:Protein kinase domain-containing protein n=1 Tax=Coleophoma cylindrospora TaxID=1849047 RepID=A0A3D8RGB9_9HELO|nr:hypothetical protein BP6252_06821 [Coleophoma cylindrospora]
MASQTMSTSEVLLEARHQHHVFDLKPSTGLSNVVQNLLRPKMQTIEGLAPEDSNHVHLPSQPSQQLINDKYGKRKENISYGHNGIISLSQKTDDDGKSHFYATRKYYRRVQESSRAYRKRVTTAFCISACLQHHNVLSPLELFQNKDGTFCEVSPFCDGGDLEALILQARKLGSQEADCYFKQLVQGVDYLHSAGVAHQDLNSKSLLLTENGVLKITNFRFADCFRQSWEAEDQVKRSSTRCGSIHYIAPEVFVEKKFDPRPVDMWAVGLVYMTMRTGKLLWRFAAEGGDEYYDKYLGDRKALWGYRPIENLRNVCGTSFDMQIRAKYIAGTLPNRYTVFA